MDHRRKISLVIILIVAIILTGTITALFLLSDEDKLTDLFDTSLISDPIEPRHDYTGGTGLSYTDYMSVSYNNITGDYRPQYKNMTAEEYKWIFGELPEFPSDFFSVLELIQSGKVTDYSRVASNYWKQPEFYSSWFPLYESLYLHNDPDTWITEGYGCFPGIKEGTIERGETGTANVYFRTGFGTESYQGLVIRSCFPESAIDLLGHKIFDNPNNVGDYLTVSITNPDDILFETFKDDINHDIGPSDWMVILEPTYQDILDKYGNFVQYKGFTSDWARLLNLSVTVASDTPPGEYVVAISIETPCFSINQEYYYSNTHIYYGDKYIPAGKIFKSGIPHFQFMLYVE